MINLSDNFIVVKRGGNMRKPVIGVLGATGVVGRNILKILEENNVVYEDIKFLASKKSAGKEIEFNLLD